MNNIKLTAFALRYVKVIEERSLMIENCLNKGNYDDLDFLATYLEGLIHIMRKNKFTPKLIVRHQFMESDRAI